MPSNPSSLTGRLLTAVWRILFPIRWLLALLWWPVRWILFLPSLRWYGRKLRSFVHRTAPVTRRLLRSTLTWVIGAILLALLLGSVRVGSHPLIPKPASNVFVTFSDLFSQFLSFSIPLIIIGLVTPAIANSGYEVGRWFGIIIALAHASTLFADLPASVVCIATFLRLLVGTSLVDVSKSKGALSSYFTVEMPSAVEVMTALLLSFVLGVGLSMVPRGALRKRSIEFWAIITRFIEWLIIPLPPLHIFGIFLNLTYIGVAGAVMKALLRVVVVALILEVVILSIQFPTTGFIGRRNPIKVLLTMLPTYLTTLGTSSSAVAIPVALRQTKKNGVSDAVASFTVPLRVTVHPVGSTPKIFSFAFATVLIQGLHVGTIQWIDFIFMFGIMMMAASGVPGSAIIAATGLLSSMLGLNDQQVALTIATYTALDSFGIATNVTGDSAIIIIMDRMASGSVNDEGDLGNVRELSFDGMAYLHAASVEGIVSPEELEASAVATRSGE